MQIKLKRTTKKPKTLTNVLGDGEVLVCTNNNQLSLIFGDGNSTVADLFQAKTRVFSFTMDKENTITEDVNNSVKVGNVISTINGSSESGTIDKVKLGTSIEMGAVSATIGTLTNVTNDVIIAYGPQDPNIIKTLLPENTNIYIKYT